MIIQYHGIHGCDQVAYLPGWLIRVIDSVGLYNTKDRIFSMTISVAGQLFLIIHGLVAMLFDQFITLCDP